MVEQFESLSPYLVQNFTGFDLVCSNEKGSFEVKNKEQQNIPMPED